MDKDYHFYKNMLIGLPIFWVGLYFIGQSGKKIAHKQILELEQFLMTILKKKV